MVVAISGASGHIGVNICYTLVKAGYSLKLLINKHREGLEGMDAEFIQGDILDPDTADKLVQGADYVIHLAARVSIQSGRDHLIKRVNIEGTSNILRASVKAKVRKFIYFSSIHTLDPFPLDQRLDETKPYVTDPTVYDATKISAEKLVIQAGREGLETNIICPTAVFGPDDYYPSLLGQAIINIHNGRTPVLTQGGYDFVDVRDLAAGTLLIMEKGISGEKYILSGTYLEITDLAALICSHSGRRSPLIVMPFRILYLSIPVLSLISSISGKRPLFTKEAFKALKNSNRCISSQKASDHVGYGVRPIGDSVRDTVKWFFGKDITENMSRKSYF